MKKTIAAAIAVFIGLSALLTACGVGDEPQKDIYQVCVSAQEKTNSAQNYSAGVTIELDADLNNDAVNAVNSYAKMTADLVNSAYLQEVTNEYPGYGTVEMTMYHDDGMTYVVNGDSEYKYPEDDESAMASAQSVADFGFTEAVFKGAELTENADGSLVITNKAPGSKMSGVCAPYLSLLDSISGVSNDYDISDVDLTVDVDADGYLRSLELTYSVKFDYNLKSASADMHILIEYYDLTAGTLPTAPEGYLDFPDYTGEPDESTSTSDDYDEMMSEQDAEAIEAAFALFEDDNVTHVANYDELYAEACEKYGKDTMDSIIAVIELFGSVG